MKDKQRCFCTKLKDFMSHRPMLKDIVKEIKWVEGKYNNIET